METHYIILLVVYLILNTVIAVLFALDYYMNVGYITVGTLIAVFITILLGTPMVIISLIYHKIKNKKDECISDHL